MFSILLEMTEKALFSESRLILGSFVMLLNSIVFPCFGKKNVLLVLNVFMTTSHQIHAYTSTSTSKTSAADKLFLLILYFKEK